MNQFPSKPITTPDKPFPDMTNGELEQALKTWAAHVKNACGWASAHFAAKQIEFIVKEANNRNLGFINPYPIKVG